MSCTISRTTSTPAVDARPLGYFSARAIGVSMRTQT